MASKSLSTDQIKGKLLQGAFTSSTPSASRLSDPIVDTPMLVTLDQLRPYEHNPRVNRNPQYEEIRESIQNRGLDAPPPLLAVLVRTTSSSAMAVIRGSRYSMIYGERLRMIASSAFTACFAHGPPAVKLSP